MHAQRGLIWRITLNDAGIYSKLSDISSAILRKISPPQSGHIGSGFNISSIRVEFQTF